MTRFLRLALTLLVGATFLFTLVVPEHVSAEDRPPLKLGLIDVSKKGAGKKAFRALKIQLRSDQIELTTGSGLEEAMDEASVGLNALRSSKSRKKVAKKIKRMMRSADVEAVFLLDVFGKGKKLQLVTLGPMGTEIGDRREKIKRGKLPKSKARKLVQEAFGELIPAVLEFRENGDVEEEAEPEEEAEVVEEEEEEEEEEEDADGSLKDEVISSRKDKSGVDTGIQAVVGPIIGLRALQMRSDTGFELDHSSPFLGIGASIHAVLTTLSGGASAVAVQAFGGFAPFTTVFCADAVPPSAGEECQDPRELSSNYARVGADLMYIQGGVDNVKFDVYVGAEATSLVVDPNPFYTGNRYISARAGLDVSLDFFPFGVRLGGGVLPVLNTENSGGAFGTSEMSIGFEGHALARYELNEEFAAALNYTFQRYVPEYPEPTVLTVPATSTDTIHTANIAIGYGF